MQSIFGNIKGRDAELIKICNDFCTFSKLLYSEIEDNINDYNRSEIKELYINNFLIPLKLIKIRKPYSIKGYYAKFKAYYSYCRVMESNGHDNSVLSFFS